MLPRATMDFETRSACDLKKHGSWIYAKHPTTEVMVLKYRLPFWPAGKVKMWHMAHPQHFIAESEAPQDLFDWIESGGLVEAHNAFFEKVIWFWIMVAKKGWPQIPDRQWRCSAAKASAHSLPRDLSGAGRAMSLAIPKDDEGRKLMLKMSKPRKPRKDEITAWMENEGLSGDYRKFGTKFTDANGYLWHEDEADIYRLWQYCEVDVLSEELLSETLEDLSDIEQEIWFMDQELNWKGAKFDLELARAALWMATEFKGRLNKELETLTGISAGTKRQQVREWLAENEDLDLPDTAAPTLEYILEHETLSGRAYRVLQILMDVNRTSTRKWQAMIDKADPDDWRVRDLLMYHGAGTGRWSGKGVQVHNFPGRDLIVKDFEEAAEAIKSRNIDWCILLYGPDIMKLLSHALRGGIIPDDGKDLMVADYSAIEARCVLWEADAQPALKVFREGGDIYCDMATGIYGFTVNKKDHPLERMFGKQAILGLGYGMGFVTFLLTCRKYKIYFTRKDCIRIMTRERLAKYEDWVKDYLCIGNPPPLVDAEEAKKYANKKRQAAGVRRRLIDEREVPEEITHELALMKYTVDVYRNRYAEVKEMWGAQEKAAIKAVQEWQKIVDEEISIAQDEAGITDKNISFSAYPWELSNFKDQFAGPVVEAGKIRWFVKGGFLNCELPSGRCLKYRDPEVKQQRTAWGELKPGLRYMSVNGVTRKWDRTFTYGGKLVENITQAVARDIMATAMLLARRGGTYWTIMSVHDELVCEVDKDKGDVTDFEELMSAIDPWAYGCPITAEAERLTRYKK